MKGSIRLDSEIGSGSEFIVEIPLEPAREEILTDDETSFADKTISPAELKMLEGLSVLVVDDDPVQLKMIAEMLAVANVKSVTEECPDRVLSLLESCPFDLLFVDLQMPGTDGFMLVEEIRRSGIHAVRELPIIALSARSDITEEVARQAGFTGFLTKPFLAAHLYGSILRYVSGIEGSIPSIQGNRQPVKVTGAQALIDFVKEDKEASLAILRSFIQETGKQLPALETAFAENDADALGKIAHKMLPLARMMGHETMISRLERLEKEEMLQHGEEKGLIASLEEQVQEAGRLADEVQKEKDDQEGM